MAAADWRDLMVEKLMPILKDAGINEFDPEKILAKVNEVADQERDKPNGERIGCSYCVDTYGGRGMAAIIGKIGKDGYGFEPPKPKPRAKKEKKAKDPTPEAPVQPDPPGPPQPPVEG